MNITEMNLAIAGIKGLGSPWHSGDDNVYYLDDNNHAHIIDYLSPELNHGLAEALLDDGWTCDKENGEYIWWKNNIPEATDIVSHEEYRWVNCLAYIEAFK